MRRVEIDEDRLISLYNEGYKYDDICLELNIQKSFLMNKITEFGLTPRFRPPQINEQEFERAYFSGISVPSLAQKFGISKNCVSSLIKKFKLREKEIAAYYSKMPLEA
jgi:hypothetical protein